VVIAPSESLIFSASRDGALRAWDLTADPAGKVLPGHLTEIKALVSARDRGRLASAALDGAINIWNAELP
jgi:pleiotropic regulator 1